jgi:hypothetical protein
MNQYTEMRTPPPKREKYCEGGIEQHFSEGAVMIAFAVHLLENGATKVEIHPDGEHGKNYDLNGCLRSLGFIHVSRQGRTSYGGVYERGHQTITVTCKPGVGDVVAKIGDFAVVAECKGGIINTCHAGQISRLRRGLCEAVGLLMSRTLEGERHVAVVPATELTRKLALRLFPRTRAAQIEIALIDQHGTVIFPTT